MADLPFAYPTATTLAGLLVELNTATGGYLGLAYVLISFIGLTTVFSINNRSNEDNLLASAFLTSIGAVYLRGVGVLSDEFLTVILILFAALIFSLFKKEQR